MAAPHAHQPDDPFWREILSGQNRNKLWMRQFFRVISPRAGHRCHLCWAPFEGLAAPIMRAIGRGAVAAQSAFLREVRIASCAEHHGGAEIDVAMLYADVRGSTQIASGMQPGLNSPR